MVSEIMLQQTPVSRVLPADREWLARWPTPAALAADPPGEAVRQWGRLGYPRRALRLHEAARIVTERHGGVIPDSYDGCWRCRASARTPRPPCASFAYRQRHPVLDTNVRRVLGRLVTGAEFPGRTLSAAEWRLAETLLPDEPEAAARWAVGVMELGALVCTAARPRCERCPLAAAAAWLRAGRPAAAARPVGQRDAGTDRQCRGRLLAVLRDATGPVPASRLDAVWPVELQRARALDGLVADGLVDALTNGHTYCRCPAGNQTAPGPLRSGRRLDRSACRQARPAGCFRRCWPTRSRRRGVGHRLGLGHTGEGELGRPAFAFHQRRR